MCLDRIDEKTKKGRGYGYKGFGIDNGKLVPNMKSLRDGWSYPEEEWFTDPTPGTIDVLWAHIKYEKGFHISKSKKHARKWGGETTRKVFYREVVASGMFCVDTVIVARQIWIAKEEI